MHVTVVGVGVPYRSGRIEDRGERGRGGGEERRVGCVCVCVCVGGGDMHRDRCARLVCARARGRATTGTVGNKVLEAHFLGPHA